MTTVTRRNSLILGLGAIVGAAGVGYAMTRGPAGYAHEFMTVGQMQASGGLVVDIRTPQEWRDTGVIDGARLVTFRDPKSFLAELGPELADGRDLILVCRSGNRTRAAASALAGTMPNRIVSIDGGMKRVISDGYRTVAPR